MLSLAVITNIWTRVSQFLIMAQSKKWCTEDLCTALQDLQTNKKSIRVVAAAYGIPKSTLFDYASGKVEIGSKQGPPTTLTIAEEQKLVDYAIHMAEIGYGRTREQICSTVKKIIDSDGRPNLFTETNQDENGGLCLRNGIPIYHYVHQSIYNFVVCSVVHQKQLLIGLLDSISFFRCTV